MEDKLRIDKKYVTRCRRGAKAIADGIQIYIDENTTTSIERTVVRLMGVDGVNDDGVPLPNIVVEHVGEKKGLGKGVCYWLGNAILETNNSAQQIAEDIANKKVSLFNLTKHSLKEVEFKIKASVVEAVENIKQVNKRRSQLQIKYPLGLKPWLYVIVATGNIYEDVLQAKAAAKQGADIIAVIRSTAQSLLDYVPYGATTEGFGGTYATQKNFQIMRAALDEATEETGRYIQLVNYCSGLAMPEIAVMGAMERLDMMLNDAMYGILFRNINMKRTFIDQYFSRMINASANIIINTGEDNYLTTSDAVEEAHVVLASQFINEELALRSGLKPMQIGLGHAFEINPDIEDGFLMELAQAQLVRQIFPDSPIKYMPPTKHMTGDIFKGYLMNGMFNLASIITGQSIQLLGMLTEAIHTPLLHDRALSIENAKYVFNNARHLHDELMFVPDGKIQKRSDTVLKEATYLLEEVAEKGIMEAIERGKFASISRAKEGGRGLDGVIKKEKDYFNPFLDIFKKRLGI